jgi:putative phosphoribosyl transferase
MNEMIFKDRVEAGQLLAGELKRYRDREDVIVLGLPRGGVPVAYEVARQLHAPLDVVVVRKLGVPGYEELAMGAIASGGIRVMNDSVVRALGVSRDAIEQTAATQLKELHRREHAYRGHEGTPEIEDKTVILVDDGIATGSTIRAAVEALRQQAPRQIIIAVPTASSDARAMLEPMVDDFIALIVPEEFRAVGQWYEDFDQTSDGEVTQLLAKAATHQPGVN